MRKQDLFRLFACAALAAVPLLIPTIARAQTTAPPAAAPAPPAPQMPPSLVPSKVVDLMTAEGSAAFGAQWKSMEAKIVEGPAIANAIRQARGRLRQRHRSNRGRNRQQNKNTVSHAHSSSRHSVVLYSVQPSA